MKKLLLFSAFVMLRGIGNSQVPVQDINCPQNNGFFSNGTPELLADVADRVNTNTGVVMLNPNKWYERGGADNIGEILGLDQNYRFELKSEVMVRGRIYAQYQQYYKNIKVENGGFTVTHRASDIPDDDCLSAYLLVLGVQTDLESVSVNALVKESGLRQILSTRPVSSAIFSNVATVTNQQVSGNIDAELMISTTAAGNCESRLVWKVSYTQEGAKESWIDARTGALLKVINGFAGLNAPIETQAYANPSLSNPDDNSFIVSLDDTTIGGITSLISGDGRVRTYDFGTEDPEEGTVETYLDELIPTTPNSEWTNEASRRVFQTHHVTTQVLPVLDDISINFGTVNVGATTVNNAKAFRTSTTNTAFIYLGALNGGTTALYDVAAHELTHAHLYDFFDYTTSGRRTLHEAIADMLGIYVESVLQGNVDWVIGDDEPLVSERLLQNNPGRNLSDVPHTCFSQIEDEQDQFIRGNPLRHLFYILSEGQSGGPVIPALGVERALTMILDGVYMLGAGEIDYELLRDATLAQAEINFSECSDEFIALFRAWGMICLPAPPSPCYTLGGTRTVCEEDNHLSICIEGGSFAENYRWTFPFEWTVLNNPVGNSVYGQCITVVGFPDYSYYPRMFTLRVYSPNSGDAQSVRVILQDCNGDDGGCFEFLIQNEQLEELATNNENPIAKIGLTLNRYDDILAEDIAYVRLFDVLGRLLFEGSQEEAQAFLSNSNYKVVIQAAFDVNRRLLSTQKSVIFE